MANTTIGTQARLSYGLPDTAATSVTSYTHSFMGFPVAVIDGTDGADTINGNVAGATIWGFGGNDTFIITTATTNFGGTGNDTFSFTDIAPGVAGTLDGNVADWETGDKIDLSNFGISSFDQLVIESANANSATVSNAADTMNIQLSGIGSLGGNLTAANFIFGTGVATPTTGADDVTATSGADSINGLAGNDTLRGNLGNDTLIGADGNDSLRGGRDNDFLRGDQNDDSLFGDLGDDSVRGGRDNDSARGGQGNDSVYGDLADDSVYGDLGNDYLRGGQGNDTIDGSSGNDSLYGDLGDDSLIGGNDNDTFFFTNSNGADTIGGWNEGDLINLTASLNGSTVTADSIFATGQDTFVGGIGSIEFDLGGGNSVVVTGILLSYPSATSAMFTIS